MVKNSLTTRNLVEAAKTFCEAESGRCHKELIGVTDGKAVGTYIEHRFKAYLCDRFLFDQGNSANGIDLPGTDIETDIKATSFAQPQSSCPFKTARQKIYGLGYNLLIFVYEKVDDSESCILYFRNCTFVEKTRTADYTLTKRLREMVHDSAEKEDIVAYLYDRRVPGDEIVLGELADEILRDPPEQGYLTISNALQWRLQYRRVIGLEDSVDGIENFAWPT